MSDPPIAARQRQTGGNVGTNAPAGVEVLPRVSPSGETLLYVLNHNSAPATVPLPEGAYTDLLTDHPLSGQADLDGYGVLILARQAV